MRVANSQSLRPSPPCLRLSRRPPPLGVVESLDGLVGGGAARLVILLAAVDVDRHVLLDVVRVADFVRLVQDALVAEVKVEVLLDLALRELGPDVVDGVRALPRAAAGLG